METLRYFSQLDHVGGSDFSKVAHDPRAATWSSTIPKLTTVHHPGYKLPAAVPHHPQSLNSLQLHMVKLVKLKQNIFCLPSFRTLVCQGTLK